MTDTKEQHKSEDGDEDEGFPWSIGLFDAHCHPTDTMDCVSNIPTMNINTLTIMSTRSQDQDLVAQVASEQGLQHTDDEKWRGVVPSFGWHPWFSHQLLDDLDAPCKRQLTVEEKSAHYHKVLVPAPESDTFIQDLPAPRPLSQFLQETRNRLQSFPNALIGEVGIDKAFRIPYAWLPEEREQRDESLTPGGREGRRLSPYRVQTDHQKKVLTAQLQLAGEMRRAVSCHGVQAHGILYETIRATFKGHEKEVLSRKERKQRQTMKEDESDSLHDQSSSPKPFPPRLCLHSYSGPADTLKQYMHPSVPVMIFVSFSVVINFSEPVSSKTEEVVRAVPDDRILVESDMHIAGEQMEANLVSVTRKICQLKGWTLTEGAKILRRNWQTFVYGIDDT